MDWILICKLCKFGKYICYNFRDIKCFLGGYFFGAPCRSGWMRPGCGQCTWQISWSGLQLTTDNVRYIECHKSNPPLQVGWNLCIHGLVLISQRVKIFRLYVQRFFAWENLGSWVPHLKCWVGSTSKILQMVTAVHYGKFSGCTYCS